MNEKILLLDDDKLLLSSMEKVVKSEGFSVDGVDNCREALKLLKQKPYDLIVANVKMPEMDGIEFIEKARRTQDDDKKIRVIIIAGQASEEAPVKAIKMQASDYLLKPFETNDFIHVINKNIRYIRLNKEKEQYVRQLEEKNKELEKANIKYLKVKKELIRKEGLSMIGKIASSVGHELRNPLGSIKNVAFFLKKYVNIEDPTADEYIDTLNDEVRTAENILSDLLNFSKKEKLNKKEVSLAKIVEKALDSATIPERISLKSKLSRETCKIYADPDKLQQALKNILENSVSSIEKKGEINIKTEKEDSQILIKVSDDGQGMSENTKKNMFIPLYTTKTRGLGLGLPVVKDIVENHGGNIDIESSYDCGTEVVLRIPARRKKG